MARIVALAAVVTSAGFAVFSSDLLISALFLGVSSVSLGCTYYLFGATQASLIEISMGAGLTTILFILSISLCGSGLVTRSKPATTRSIGLWLCLTVLFAACYALVPRVIPIEELPAFPVTAPLFWAVRLTDLWMLVFVIVSGGIGVATLFRPGGARR